MEANEITLITLLIVFFLLININVWSNTSKFHPDTHFKPNPLHWVIDCVTIVKGR